MMDGFEAQTGEMCKSNLHLNFVESEFVACITHLVEPKKKVAVKMVV